MRPESAGAYDRRCAAITDAADHGRGIEAVTAEGGDHCVQRFRRAGHEQATAGLRIGEQRAVFRRETVGEHDALAVAGPVAVRRAKGATACLHVSEEPLDAVLLRMCRVVV